MPRLTYTPDGAEPKVWDFAFGRLLSPERIAIEKATGLGWQDVQRGFFENRAVVVHALLWTMLRRDLPSLRAEEVVFCDDEIGLDLTDSEVRDGLKELEAKGSLSDDEAVALAELRARVAAAGDSEDAGPKEE